MRPHALLLSAYLALLPLALPMHGAETTQTRRDLPAQDTTLVTSRYTNGVPNPTPLVEGEGDANVMRLVSQILQRH